MTHYFHKSILRAYDIRGIVGETISNEDAFYIGKTFATSIIRKAGITLPKIAMGYDGRLSSPELSRKLSEGMQSAGAKVYNIGLGPTPMLYFAVNHLSLDAGIMLTGSHNPPTHNGFKMMIGKKSFYGDQILELGKYASDGDFEEGEGSEQEISVFGGYIDVLVKAFTIGGKDMSVAWDPGNGAAGEVVEALCKRLPGKHLVINGKIDGNFPSHHPDPTVPENLVQLIDVVKQEGCDFGVAFDGDGDRLGAVDSTGRIVFGDQLMILFSREVLKSYPQATIIADVKASQALFDDIAANGGNPIMWKTGHSLIKTKMLEEKAKLAGEMSGHIFFADKYYGYDDGIYSAVRLCSLLANKDQSFDNIISALPEVFNTPEIRIDTDEERKFIIVEEIKERVKLLPDEVSEVDGVRVKNKHGWWLARASNTQSAIIVRCEGHNDESLQILKNTVTEQLSLSGIKQVV